MNKQTSDRVSGIAADYLNFGMRDLDAIRSDADAEAKLILDIQALAGSALSQDETPGQDNPDPKPLIGRIQNELHGLAVRISKLATVLNYEGPLALSYYQRDLANVQIGAMKIYYNALSMRLADMESSAPEEIVYHRPPVASEPVIGDPVEIGGHSEDSDGPIPFGG